MKHKHTFALLLLSVALPVQALAATLKADDTVAGLGTDIDISAADANQQLQVIITPPMGNELVADVTADATGKAHVQIPGQEVEISGMYQVALEKNGAPTGDKTQFEVLADATHGPNSSLTSDVSYIQADGADAAKVTVILRDRFGNPLANRPVKLISSRAQDIVQALQQETDTHGEQNFSVRTQLPGTFTLRAIDFISGEILTTELSIDASGMNSQAMGGTYETTPYSASSRGLYGPGLRAQIGYGQVAEFIISAPRNLKVNEDATIRITAVDADGNRVEDYTGTVYISSTDPNAFLPIGGEIPFRDQDFGEKQLTLGLRFRTPDEHELHAQDAKNPAIRGYTTISVSGGNGQNGSTQLIQITEPKDNTIVNSSTVTITGTTEPFVNLLVTGGVQEVKGETDINGEFQITVQLDPEETAHSVRVRDDTGLLDSGSIDITLDQNAPGIVSVNVSPENAIEGTDMLIVIETETDVASFAAQLDGEELEMNTLPNKPNTYQALLEAPKAGSHELSITLSDAAENVSTESTIFKTSLKGLPKVTGLTATTEGDVIDLQWDAVTEEKVDAYRIYVGETPTEFSFSLDSNQATTAAQITGLQPGTDYYFAVTALKGERESDEKSAVEKATVFGIRIETLPQNNSIQLDWSNMQTTIPLSSFILEYGVEPGVYTEQRILNGQLRNYTIRDLLNEVTYYIELTPVSLTGERIETMVANADAKPVKVAGGFRPSAAEAVPAGLVANINNTPPPNLHQGAPATTSTGLPSYMWWLAVISAGIIASLYWRSHQKAQTAIAFMQEMNNRYYNN